MLALTIVASIILAISLVYKCIMIAQDGNGDDTLKVIAISLIVLSSAYLQTVLWVLYAHTA